MVSLSACERAPADKPLQYSQTPAAATVRYRFAVLPVYNPQKLGQAYLPLIDHLNRQLPDVHIELEASRDYHAYEQKYRAREPEFLLSNPWQTLDAIKVGYHVVATAGSADDFKGIFIVRKDGGIKQPADLKGKVVSYPSPTALAAAIMPQYFLHTQGIDIKRDIRNSYVGSQESSIMNVYLGKSAAGATWPPQWRLFQKEHPAEAAQLELIWETPSLINNAVMVRDDVPPAVQARVRAALLDLARTPAGQTILKGMETDRFRPAEDASYDQVRAYVARFEKAVRPVDSP